MGRLLGIAVLINVALVVSSCSDEPVTFDADVDHYINSDSVIVRISTEQPSLLVGGVFVATVSVENTTEQLVAFGRGSSSCELGAVIRVGDDDHLMLDARMCTADEEPWSVGPGETKEELYEWKGYAEFDGERLPVPVGSYEVRGCAGQYIGDPIVVEVRE